MQGSEAMADLYVKWRAIQKWADDVAYKKDGLQARLQQSQRGQNKVGESPTRVQGAINHFSDGVKEYWEDLVRRADEDCRKMLNQLGTWMGERVFEAHQTYFEIS